MLSKKYAECQKQNCVACGACKNVCPRGAIKIQNGCFAIIDSSICVGCGKCEKICPAGTIILKEREAV